MVCKKKLAQDELQMRKEITGSLKQEVMLLFAALQGECTFIALRDLTAFPPFRHSTKFARMRGLDEQHKEAENGGAHTAIKESKRR